ncbi:FkbM family methyltransferase [Methylobacterium sp. J-048]|uniref:FkbM family methyltransferase n=1 Tax=Methylobacterium sp. J-048 TaxID=2836635 RepID=UPI001FBBD000|nr:FkbM family methyltransferase [Methylobacterium sp. J-048]MCJ2056264.1 FkbM family methyltransferase [Methylobacterium sp. J-048]
MRELSIMPGYSFDLVSGGQALTRYVEEFSKAEISIRAFQDEATALKGADGSPFPVPEEVATGADLIWLPWAHRHLISEALAKKTVATILDFILLRNLPHIMPQLDDNTRNYVARIVEAETVVTSRLLDWHVPMALLSHEVQNDLIRLFERAGHSTVIPLPGAHKTLQTDSTISLPGLPDRYILCPATIFPHKNHIALITALGRCRDRLPLVLTGPYTNYLPQFPAGHHGRHIFNAIAHAGLVWGKDVLGLGMLPDNIFNAVLRRADLMVFPTLAEGGGFPVAEALTVGIPVACSNIPVLREQLSRIGGNAVLFDPHDCDDIARKLEMAIRQIDNLKTRAQTNRHHLTDTNWGEVARRYVTFFERRLADIRRPAPNLPATARFYGQWNPPQDELLFRRYFSDMQGRPGHFIECGAFDGVTESSGLFFEQTLGWTGINVEPFPDAFKALCNNRPRANNVHAALSDRDGWSEFRQAVHPYHGRNFNNGSISHTKKHLDDLLAQGCHFESFNVATLTYRSLLKQHPLSSVDLLILDVEGAESAVIDGMKDSPILPRVLCIEYDHNDVWRLIRDIEKMGYRYDGLIHNNAIFVRRDGAR